MSGGAGGNQQSRRQAERFHGGAPWGGVVILTTGYGGREPAYVV